MKFNAAEGAAFILIFLSLILVSCGDMDSLYPSNGSYQVRTLVNDSSLEECSVIRSGDKIRPYFVASVVNDPDLTGLLVYLLNPQGELVGERFRYMLQFYVDEADLPIPEPETEENSGFEATEPTETGEPSDEAADGDSTPLPTAETEFVPSGEAEGPLTWEIPEQMVRERWGFNNNRTSERSTDRIVSIKSFDQELPYFSMPRNLEPGPYNLVFEALGGRGTLSRTETDIFYLGSVDFNLKDISLYLPTLSGSQLIPPGTMVLLEAGLDFDSRLDPYIIWYQGKNIISEGKISDGAGTLLWKAPEQAGFYSLRVETFPIRLKRGFTGVSRGINLPVSPKAVNIGYFFDKSPQYVIQSPLSEGISYPEQLRLIETMALAKETDDTEETTPVVPPSPPELLRWYQFSGNLLDSVSTLGEWSLTPVNATVPQWAAVGQSYGLSIGTDDSYSLSPVSFFQKEEDQGGGIFLFYIKPRTEGVILNAFFPLQTSESDGAWITVTSAKNAIVVRLSTREKAVEMLVYTFESRAFIPVVVEFYIRPYRIEAKLSLGEAEFLQHSAESVDLPAALTGEGRITLGVAPTDAWTRAPVEVKTEPPAANPSGMDIFYETTAVADNTEGIAMLREIDSSPQTDEFTPQPVIVEDDKLALYTVWNEFAVLFSGLPLIHEEPPEEDPDTQPGAQGEDSPFVEANQATQGMQQASVPAANVIAPAAASPELPEAVPTDMDSELADGGSAVSDMETNGIAEPVPSAEAIDHASQSSHGSPDDTETEVPIHIETPAADAHDAVDEEYLLYQ